MTSKAVPKSALAKRPHRAEGALLIRGSKKDLAAIEAFTKSALIGPVVVEPARISATSAKIEVDSRVPGRAPLSSDEKDILERVKPWAGSESAALRWYRSQMIPALGDQTAESLVRTGQSHLVRRYLDAIAAGGFA